jgi:hypothetical protein
MDFSVGEIFYTPVGCVVGGKWAGEIFSGVIGSLCRPYGARVGARAGTQRLRAG